MIVVTTPTGQVGSEVVNTLLDAGTQVRVIVRDPGRIDPLVRDKVEVVEGSHGDPDVTGKAFAGADAVFHVVPPDPRADSVSELYLTFATSVAQAVTSQGVERLVAVTTMGKGYPKQAGNLSAALDAEGVLENTGVSYRALRLPFFMENLLHQVDAIRRGMFALPNTADRELLTVATSDIAAAAADLLLDDSWRGQDSLSLVSPDQLTPHDMADVMSQALERLVRFQQLDLEDYKATLVQYGSSQAWAQGLAAMAEAQNDGIYDIRPRDPRTVAPTGFRQWCDQVLKPAVLT